VHPQRAFIDAWAEEVAREPRVAALLHESGVKLLTKMEAILKEASSESQRQIFNLGPERTFYLQNYAVKMSVYEVRRCRFDLAHNNSYII
jgi:hypothetical protein